MDVPLRFVIPWRSAGRGMGRKMGLWSFLRPLPKSCLRDAFIPFSAGARVCPGAGFAMIEGPLLIAAILRKYHVSITDNGRPVPVAHLTVRAKDGIWLKFQSRD